MIIPLYYVHEEGMGASGEVECDAACHGMQVKVYYYLSEYVYVSSCMNLM